MRGVTYAAKRTSTLTADKEALARELADFGVSHVQQQLAKTPGTVGYAGLRLMSAGEAVWGAEALGEWQAGQLLCCLLCWWDPAGHTTLAVSSSCR